MFQRYTKKTTRLFSPTDKLPFKVSRSKIDLFLECPRCFYLDRRCGVPRPQGFPFTLNSAVDHLLKKEFDVHRVGRRPHPLMTAYGIDAIPFEHADLEDWRTNFTGVQYVHKPTHLTITGAVDDVWVKKDGELLVVDYKATSKDTEVNLDAEWQDGYKRQMEVYQWLLRKKGFRVSSTGYFVYANGKKDKAAFDGKLEFDVSVIAYTGSDSWIEPTLLELKKCLENNSVPAPSPDCEYCAYISAYNETLGSLDPVSPNEKKSSAKKKVSTKKQTPMQSESLF